ncbi:MAG: flagellin [Bythopirellula sp.]|nr:flagellin [Bythopirellula sp.]
MAGVIPIPSSRVSGYLLRTRLTQQFQKDQLDLFRLQEQIATGQRIVLPSDDAPAALRAISLRRLIERKEQITSNVRIGQQYLAASDTALQDVATQLANLKGSTLGVAGTITSEEQRQTALEEINGYLENLVNIANRQYQGRYLFSGSLTSQQPYSLVDGNVVYNGDAGQVQNYSDFGVLFSSSISGQEVFGGTSAQVEGTVDLNPQLGLNTSLSSLRQGRGIASNGALQISDGTNISIVDISGARTIGDVVRQIQENPPTGREVKVSVTPTGLTLQITGGPSGANLSVQEVGNGTAARELGILNIAGVGTSPLAGEDLDPQLLKTTRLEDLLGAKARTTIQSANNNNDILLEATANGAALNGVTVQFVDDELLRASSGLTAGNEIAEYDTNARAASAALSFTGSGNDLILTANTLGVDFNDVQIVVQGGATAGSETVTYDSGNKRLTISVASNGSSQIQDVITAINTNGTFTATRDSSLEAALVPTATIDAADIGVVQGNTGNSGGAAKTLYVRIEAGVTTANQVISAINAQGTFTATADLNDATSAANAGTGVVSLDSNAELTAGGAGTTLDQTSGLRVVNGGATHEISFENAETVEDLLNILNASEANVSGEINAAGTGISIRSRLSGTDFQIGENGGSTATQLGVRTYDTDTRLSDLNYGVGVPTGEGFKLPAEAGTDFTITTQNGSYAIDLTGAETLAEVVTAINTVTGADVTASLAPPGNILRLVDNTAPSGAAFSITQAAGSLTAQYLGIVPNGASTASTTTGTLTGDDARYTDFTITVGGQDFGIDLSGAETIGDVIDAINAIAVGFTATLSSTGNGITLSGSGSITVTSQGESQTAELLGFIPQGQTSASATGSLTSTDRNTMENESVFNTLIRLRDALTAGDINAVERALADINTDIDRVTFARAEIGATAQGLELSENSLEDEQIQLKSALSEEIDVDLVAAISELTARQIAMQASLQVTANILQLSLLDFI